MAVPITGLVAGAGLAALTAQGLDNARSNGAADPPSAVDAVDHQSEAVDPVADARRVRADDGGRHTLLQPQALVSPLAYRPPVLPMVESVLSSPVWSGSSGVGFVAAPAPRLHPRRSPS